MEMLPPTGWGDVATKAELDAPGAGLRGEMAGLRAELKGDMTELRAEPKGEMAALGSCLELRMAQPTRTLILTIVGFALTVWLSLLGGSLLG